MLRVIRQILLLAPLAACAAPAPPTSAPVPTTVPARPAAAPDPRMDAVLAGLRPRVEIAGRELRWTLEERMAAHSVPAASIAVIEGGEISWARAVGVKEAGSSDSVTAATLFQAGSVSKPVAATAMLRLVERGTLDLDADVNRYLTSWHVPENRFTGEEKVTLRRIVSHSAGLTVHGFRGYAPGEPVPGTVQVLQGAPPANSAPVVVDTFPGAVFRYSGGGFTVMQQLLEDATGTPFPALVRDLVLRPAGMERSTYEQPLPSVLTQDATRGHDPRGAPVPGGWHVMPELAAAGLWTIATDLARWAVGVADAYTGRSTRLLSTEMARRMLTPQKEGAGLGLPISGSGRELAFGHSGANVGFRAFVRMYPELGTGAVVMANSVNGGALAEELLRAVAVEYGWPEFAPQRVTPVPLDWEAAAGLVGSYLLRVGPGRPAEVRLDGDRLMLHGPQQMVQELIPESRSGFIAATTGWRVEFTRDEGGRATAIRIFTDAGGQPIEGERTG